MPQDPTAINAASEAKVVLSHTSRDLGGRGADEARTLRTERILSQIDSLPTLSPIASRLLTLGAADQVELGEITKVIESDPAMAAKVLGLCRRSDRGLGERITSVRRAVVMLGLEPIRAAALSVCVFDLMKGAAQEPQPAAADGLYFDRSAFWKHLIGVACAAELIAAGNPRIKVAPEEAFVAGLLHAIGKPALDLILPKSYARVLALAEREGLESAPVERSVIGLDHHTAGKRLAEHWGLPESLRDVMWLYGAAPDGLTSPQTRALVGLVTIAKCVCRQLHLGWSGDYSRVPDTRALWKQYGLGTGGDGFLSEQVESKLHAAVADRLTVLGLSECSSLTDESRALLLESLATANRQLARINQTLETRAARSDGYASAMKTITEFYRGAAASTDADSAGGEERTETVDGVAARIVLSARRLLGPGDCGLVCRNARDVDWELYRADVNDTVKHVCTLTSSARHDAGTVGVMLPDDMRALRTLTIGGVEAGTVILHARSFEDAGLSDSGAQAIRDVWSSAFVGAVRNAEHRRISERLAETNRGLAAMQTSLTRAQSLERLAEMTAGAAHEMNNPLTVISGHAQLLGTRVRDPKDKAAVTAIVSATAQLTDLITSLHLVARPPEPNPSTVELDWAIGQAVAAARQRTNREIAANTVLTDMPQTVRIDPSLFCQALSELVANAAEADPQGTLQISATIDPVEDRLAICVADRGKGFSERALEHAFDAFFSDKPAGRGRGLGLTRARSMAEAMRGRIVIATTPGQGSRVTLTVPNWRAPAAKSQGAGAKAAKPVSVAAAPANTAPPKVAGVPATGTKPPVTAPGRQAGSGPAKTIHPVRRAA